MYSPFNYQISEYDCVPTAINNGISFLFQRKEIPPMVIRHIYLYENNINLHIRVVGNGGHRCCQWDSAREAI
jgi:hypothetical protein